MKSVIFDAGPIISITANNLLWLAEPLKNAFGGEFYIAPRVKYELVERPLLTKKYEFEALQVLEQIKKGVFSIVEKNKIAEKTDYLYDLANHCYTARNHYITLFHYGEVESLASAIVLESDAIVIDERSMRVLIEDAERLRKILCKKLHMQVSMDKANLRKLQKEIKKIRVIRSAELVAAAYELGLLDKYVLDIEKPRKTLLDSLLWGLKLSGCAIRTDDILKIIQEETKNERNIKS